MNRTRLPGALSCGAFTLVEILISILILALGVLGLGALFPVIIREQRLGTDATAGVTASNAARAMLTQAQWGTALAKTSGGTAHPALALGADGATQFLYDVMRDTNWYAAQPNMVYPVTVGLGRNFTPSNVNSFQSFGQGEWFTANIITGTGNVIPAGTLQLGAPGTVFFNTTSVNGFVEIPVAARLYPGGATEPQFVWDIALQRVSIFDHTRSPLDDAVRAAVFVRRIDPRIRPTGNAKTVREALLADSTSADFRFPVGEDALGNPTLDGTDQYSTIKTLDVDFFFDPSTPTMTYRDRLYQAQVFANGAPPNLARMWAQIKQPGQKLVDNLGNIYTVIGSGTETGVGSGEYVKIDPPVPESVTRERAAPMATDISTYSNPRFAKRAIRQVAFTPQIPVSVTLVELAKGSGQ